MLEQWNGVLVVVFLYTSQLEILILLCLYYVFVYELSSNFFLILFILFPIRLESFIV